VSVLTPDEIKAMRQRSIYRGAVEFWAVAHAVCDEYGVKVSAMSAPTRGNALICEARDMLCLIAHGRGYSQPQIGRWLGRDHSSVGAAIDRAENCGAAPMFKTCRNEKARLI
jgi:chromosomal replication initiation ATPase DnaA